MAHSLCPRGRLGPRHQVQRLPDAVKTVSAVTDRRPVREADCPPAVVGLTASVDGLREGTEALHRTSCLQLPGTHVAAAPSRARPPCWPPRARPGPTLAWTRSLKDIFLCVCVYVCVHVCVCMCMCVCMWVCVHVRVHAGACVCAGACPVVLFCWRALTSTHTDGTELSVSARARPPPTGSEWTRH